MSESRMSERSETESERDLDGIDVVGYMLINALNLHFIKYIDTCRYIYLSDCC